MLDFVAMDFLMSIEFVLNFSLGFSCMRFLAVSNPLVLLSSVACPLPFRPALLHHCNCFSFYSCFTIRCMHIH